MILQPKYIMIVAGEASGDLHGANLVKAVLNKDRVAFFGIGGPAMEGAGVELLYHIKDLSVMGITEVLSKLPNIFSALGKAKKALKNRNPDLLILIDFPDFNLKLAKAAKKLGIPVLYYISPKIWAWRSGRAKTLKKRISHLAIILPFEKAFFDQFDIPVTYVGNPLLDTKLLEYAPVEKKEVTHEKIIGLLPGSRVKEITRILPVMMAAAKLLSQEHPDYKFLVSVAPSIDPELVHGFVSPYQDSVRAELVMGEITRVFEIADFLIAASGTVTLEAAIFGIPMVVTYRVSAFSHFLARMLIEVEFISLVNLVAGRAVVPELVQQDACAPKLAQTVDEILSDPARMNLMKSELRQVREMLGEPGASGRVADIALRMIEQ